MMSRIIFTATQIAYHLSLTIIVKKDDETVGMTIPLLPVTTLFFIAWQVRQLITRAQGILNIFITAWQTRLNIVLKVSAIFCKATAYGLGVAW